MTKCEKFHGRIQYLYFSQCRVHRHISELIHAQLAHPRTHTRKPNFFRFTVLAFSHVDYSSDANVRWGIKVDTSEKLCGRLLVGGWLQTASMWSLKWFVFATVKRLFWRGGCWPCLTRVLLTLFGFFKRQPNPFGSLLIENKAIEAEHWAHTYADSQSGRQAGTQQRIMPFRFRTFFPSCVWCSSFECFGLMHRDCF